MILTGPEILRQVELGKIHISPFNDKHLNPNSYDFTLGDTLKVYSDEVIDTQSENKTSDIKIRASGTILQPDKVYLAHTNEVFGTDDFVPIFFAKSSVGRLGLFVHCTANLIDIGYRGQWTLQLHAVQPVRIYPHIRIGQATFWAPTGEINLYRGKYQNSRGAVAAKL